MHEVLGHFARVGAHELEARAGEPRRIAWAQLLARVFAIDVTVALLAGGIARLLVVRHRAREASASRR